MKSTLAITIATFCILTTAATAQFEYALDDGTGEVNIGPIFEADVLWGNYFYVKDDYTIITSLQLALGSIDAGMPIKLHLFNDPDNDGDPANAIPLAEAAGFTVDTELDEFISFDIDPTTISGGFFIGAQMMLDSGLHPARLDTDTVMGRSWLFYDGEIDLYDLGGSPYILNMDDAPFPGTWMIRAPAIPAAPGIGFAFILALPPARARRRNR